MQLGAALTLLTVGVASSLILINLIEANGWPGRIKAVIWDNVDRSPRGLEVGTYEVINPPLYDPADASLKSNVTSTALDTPESLQLSNGKTHSPEPSVSYCGGGLSASSISLRIPNDKERRWPRCWSILFHYSLRFTPSDFVVDSIGHHLVSDHIITLHFACEPGGSLGDDQIDIILLRSPVVDIWAYVIENTEEDLENYRFGGWGAFSRNYGRL